MELFGIVWYGDPAKGEWRVTDEWLTATQAMAYLKVSKSTLYRLCSEGKLPYFLVGGSGDRRFKRSDLDAALVPGRGSAKLAA
jgi:excisionase family DNA binding protein